MEARDFSCVSIPDEVAIRGNWCGFELPIADSNLGAFSDSTTMAKVTNNDQKEVFEGLLFFVCVRPCVFKCMCVYVCLRVWA